MLQQCTIVLVGLSGAGKSSVGRLLATRLDWPLRDTDTLIEQAAGRSVARIFAEQGEARFRDLEAGALRTALTPPAIVATGGGIVLRAENRALLRARALVPARAASQRRGAAEAARQTVIHRTSLRA